jgi:hypothetical protein
MQGICFVGERAERARKSASTKAIEGSVERGTRNPPNLTIDAVSSLVIGREELGADAGRQVILNARLLASQKRSHVWRQRAQVVLLRWKNLDEVERRELLIGNGPLAGRPGALELG